MFEILLILAFYLAWNIGGNDVANSIGSVYGSKALSLKKALVLAALLEFLGVMFLSSGVTQTVGEGITVISQSAVFLILITPALWLTLASFKKIPVSATQAVIGSIIGYGIISGSFINWTNVFMMFVSWLITPFATLFWTILVYYMFRNMLSKLVVKFIEWDKIQRIFAFAQIFSSGLLAFAHGANNASLAIGMLYGFENIFFLEILAGVGMALGILTIGSRVVKTVGRGITFITPLSGFVSQISSASIIILFSAFGIPVSTTHIVVASIIGIGLHKINWETLGKIILFGFFTLPITALIVIVLSLIV